MGDGEMTEGPKSVRNIKIFKNGRSSMFSCDILGNLMTTYSRLSTFMAIPPMSEKKLWDGGRHENTSGQSFREGTKRMNDSNPSDFRNERSETESAEGGDESINDHQMNESEKTRTKFVGGDIIIPETNPKPIFTRTSVAKQNREQFVRGRPGGETPAPVARSKRVP